MPKRLEKLGASSSSGIINAVLSVCSRSLGDGARLASKVAMLPSRITKLAWCSASKSQNASVWKVSTIATDAPRVSIEYTAPVPPTWNSGRITSCRSSAPTKDQELPLENACRYDDITPLDGPVVPEV